MSGHHYARHIGDLKKRLADAVDRDVLRELHRVRPWRHFVVVARHVLLAAACVALLWQSRLPWLWAPAAVLQGFLLLGFVILLHEQVHDSVFRGTHSHWQRWLGRLYALPVGMSPTQFRLWHLAHHDELGSRTADPKRAHLSPKRNRRWLKALYATPALFFIYARASRDVAEGYPTDVRRAIRNERVVAFAALVLGLAGLTTLGGGWVTVRVWALPVLFAFPLAFTLNRLGQHYHIDPDNPAAWSSRVDGNRVWHFLFLWANFHIEHHYFPRVPFYNLRRLNRELRPFFERERIPNRTYREIVWNWIVRNREAHTDWDRPVTHAPARESP